MPQGFTSEDGWPCSCPRKLPVSPDTWENGEPCPWCKKPLMPVDYATEQPLAYDA